MEKIKIIAGEIVAWAEIFMTRTGKAIFEALPISGVANRWGDEIYFSIPLFLPLEEDAKEIVEEGDLGYWPEGHSFCIFFGPTPISRGKEIRPASKVNLFGRIIGDPEIFKNVKNGALIKVEKG